MKSRRAAAALLFAVATAACSPGDQAAPSATVSSPSPTPSNGIVTPGATGTPVFEESAEVLDVALEDPLALDPIRVRNQAGLLVARQLYEGLTRWDQAQEQVVPAAAESWTVADRGATFIFQLRTGMTFHDGSPVTARDFVFAFDRLAQKESASEVAYVLERVDGFEEVNREGTLRHLPGLSTRGPGTLVVRLDRPYYDFPAVLTHPALVPLPKHAVTDYETFLRRPTGNGAFQMAEQWSPGNPLVLRAFAGFYETPELDGLRFVPVTDAAASWLQFLDGEFDVARVPAGQEESARELAGDRGFGPSLGAYFFGLNVERIQDKRVRRAINLAIDRQRIARDVYRGNMDPPRGVVPTAVPGFLENLCFRVCDYRPKQARRLVQKVPRAARRVQIEFTSGPPHRQVVALVMRDLRRAGLRPVARGYRFPDYVKLLEAGEQNMFRLGWFAEYPVADVFLGPLFSSDSPDNHFGFSSARVDRLLLEAHSEPAPGRRVQLYIAAEKEIIRSLPIVPIGTFISKWAAQPSVHDIVFDVTGGFDAVSVFIEPDDDSEA